MDILLKELEQQDESVEQAVSLLLVDDETRPRESLASLLASEFPSIEQACDVQSAINCIRKKQFDLILLDLNMPGPSGHEVLRFIRDNKLDIKVIVLSGETCLDKVTEAIRLGAYDFIRKPYDFNELKHTIKNALDKRAVEREKKDIETRLKNSEKLHRYMVDNSPDLIYILDTRGHFKFINASFLKLLGYSQEFVIGKHYSFIVHEEDKLKAQYIFNERRTDNRSTRNIELRLKLHQKKETKTFEASTTPIELSSMGLYEVGDMEQLLSFQGTYGVARDISERKEAEKLITYQAYHDLLTKLPNRALLRDRLELAIHQCSRTDETLVLMFLDLDRFKLVNDSFGHVVGDELLVEVAQRLKTEIRTGDTLARLGGDEFMLLLPQPTSRRQAELVAKKLIDSLQHPFILQEKEVYINVSIGISIFGEDTKNIDTLIQNADKAMYSMKYSGKNGYCFFSKKMEQEAEEKLSIESGLHRALKFGEFEVYYQPQVNSLTGNIEGVEALVRWSHPEQGLLSPAYFLKQAEESRIIEQISDWVLNRVAEELFSDQSFIDSNIKVSINLTSFDILKREFPDSLISLLDKYNISPNRIMIEITENILMADLKLGIEKLRVLDNKGVSIAIDDFGTGYSSLSYLRELPVHAVKIDRSFTSQIESSGKGAGLVAAIVGIAHGLNIDVIAEGVETDYQANYLRELSCPLLQGYLFSKPVAINEFLTQVKAQQVPSEFGMN